MGNRQGRVPFDDWDKDDIQRVTGLPPSEIQELQREFFQAAGRDGVINMNEFETVYSRFPGAQRQGNLQRQIARVFRTFDRDNTGTLSFDEFINGVIMMNHDVPRRDRINHLVRQNNPRRRRHGDGNISSQYGHQVFRRLNEYYGLPTGTEHQQWRQIDHDNRGHVTHDEFMDFIGQQEDYNRRYQ